MTTHMTGTFKIASWDEQPYEEVEARKLTRASVAVELSGDLEGDGSAEWLMCYRPDQTATFVGLQRLAGQTDGRSGSFVVESRGTFDGTQAKGSWRIVEGSGTDDLKGISGDGGFQAPHGSEATFALDYDLG